MDSSIVWPIVSRFYCDYMPGAKDKDKQLGKVNKLGTSLWFKHLQCIIPLSLSIGRSIWGTTSRIKDSWLVCSGGAQKRWLWSMWWIKLKPSRYRYYGHVWCQREFLKAGKYANYQKIVILIHRLLFSGLSHCHSNDMSFGQYTNFLPTNRV